MTDLLSRAPIKSHSGTTKEVHNKTIKHHTIHNRCLCSYTLQAVMTHELRVTKGFPFHPKIIETLQALRELNKTWPTSVQCSGIDYLTLDDCLPYMQGELRR